MSDVATQLEDLRDTVGEIDTLAAFTLDAFERADWGGADRQLVERMTYAIGMIAQGPGEGMSAQDAEIVRRIRARCPDNRYEGASDAELLQLFERNKRVLNRSDEDVIAAMTHQK